MFAMIVEKMYNSGLCHLFKRECVANYVLQCCKIHWLELRFI